MILRARIVLPICGPAIEDGAILVTGDRIGQVGKWSELKAARTKVCDLGEVVLLPGLVNAHCHLDYSNLKIPRAKKSFTDWVRTIIRRKNEWAVDDYRESWMRGARMLEKTGTTTVGDIEAVPELLPSVWRETRLRVYSFLEMTGVASGLAPQQILADTIAKESKLKSSKNYTGLSPHALYSTVPELLKLTAARAKKMRITMHIAESEAEMQMYGRRTGELFEWLSKFRDMSDCGGMTPVQAVHRAGLLRPNFLAVHGNYLTRDDVQLLAKSGTSLVHCPSSHAYFGHRRFPYQQLARAGVNICLGTDSMASMAGRELNMFTEMEQFARTYPSVSPVKILRMATHNGARALGLLGAVGELRPGCFADFVAVPFRGKARDSHSAVLGTKRIDGVFTGGKYRPVK
ncbi:MAG: Atrazine chlorohydrolase [Verrucomicrobiales bacterium]|nr:Atrazine chlorohydrolase [Verrucomicrobiales bacterium]